MATQAERPGEASRVPGRGREPRGPVPRVDPQRCTPSARRRGDPLMATAAPAARWLLLEQPGAWGRNALRQSLLAPVLATKLAEACAERGVRIQVIRRPPKRAEPVRRRRWAYVDSGTQPHPTTWWGEYGEDAELLDLSFDGSQGTPSTEPILLVCTHARHDACCALFGRPVYSALAKDYPDNAWETSHVGGDRFAANLVILPEGLYYGGLDGDSATHVLSAHENGTIEPAYYRGRSVHSVPTQAAEHYLREHLGEWRVNAIVSLDLQQADMARWVARLGHVGAGEFEVEVATTHTPALHRLTCSAMHPAAARLFELLSLRVVQTG